LSAEADRAHVRLAELVAALSLGVDLGFGQPMEHVLRQCLIALRMAERIGLDDEQRAVVYYTALRDGRHDRPARGDGARSASSSTSRSRCSMRSPPRTGSGTGRAGRAS
jgi:hypothetical protein